MAKSMKVFCSIFFLLCIDFAGAITPERRLESEAQEKMAMEIFKEIKCIVCDGQTIDSADTEFSYNMRKLIREKIFRGKNEKKIKEELVEEFGENILTSSSNRWLFLIPFIFSLLTIVWLHQSRKKFITK
jgi:cytochrome c-type biogenesis protein CcmH